jgi:hypothetical protein
MAYLDVKCMVYARCVCRVPCSRRVHGASHPARSNMLLPVMVATSVIAKEHFGCRPSGQCTKQQEACIMGRMRHTNRCQLMHVVPSTCSTLGNQVCEERCL